MVEWEKYACDDPPRRGRDRSYTGNALELTEVYHVAHLSTSYSILRDRKVKAGLIFDKSVLNTERILVTWLSPNYWTPGSRYGTVAFSFDFEKIAKGRNYYWVEVIKYQTPAPRILITDKDYTGHKHLIPYDPEVANGPWKKIGKQHWWGNGKSKITLEFMLEEDLLTRDVAELWFTKHNNDMCCIDLSSCREVGVDAPESRKRFMASILGQRIPITKAHFVNDETGIKKANDNLKNGIRTILYEAREADVYGGSIHSEHESAEALVLSALTFLGQDERLGFEDILRLFKSHDDFKRVLHDIVVTRFKLPDDSSLFKRGV